MLDRWTRHSALLSLLLLVLVTSPAVAESLDRSTKLWGPVLEWTLANPNASGNPYDLEASVTFRHIESGETRRTGMFYDGEGNWRFRSGNGLTRSNYWTGINSCTSNSAGPTCWVVELTSMGRR